jgi:hypothetical protein
MSESGEDGWLRYLLRVGPTVDTAILHQIAERLAWDGPDELLALSVDLQAIAGVVAEEARAEAMATPA